jgi:hypothetical protein
MPTATSSIVVRCVTGFAGLTVFFPLLRLVLNEHAFEVGLYQAPAAQSLQDSSHATYSATPISSLYMLPASLPSSPSAPTATCRIAGST